MLEFNGYLTGVAEKRYHKRMRTLGQGIVGGGLLLVFPGVLCFAIRLRDWEVIAFFLGASVCIWLLTLIPKNKKERKSITPKKICIKDGYMVCVADQYTETRQIKDVKLVKDFGEYYEVCFPFGKLSDKFICQKSLLTKGSVQEFESLFNGKIRKKHLDQGN